MAKQPPPQKALLCESYVTRTPAREKLSELRRTPVCFPKCLIREPRIARWQPVCCKPGGHTYVKTPAREWSEWDERHRTRRDRGIARV